MKKIEVIMRRQQSQSMHWLILLDNHIDIFDEQNHKDDSFKYIYKQWIIEINLYYLKTMVSIWKTDRIMSDLLSIWIAKERNNIDKKHIYPNWDHNIMKMIYALSVKGKIYTIVWNNYINKYWLIENPDIFSNPGLCKNILLFNLLFPKIWNINTLDLAIEHWLENFFELKIFRTWAMQARYILQILKDPVMKIYKRTLTQYQWNH